MFSTTVQHRKISRYVVAPTYHHPSLHMRTGKVRHAHHQTCHDVIRKRRSSSSSSRRSSPVSQSTACFSSYFVLAYISLEESEDWKRVQSHCTHQTHDIVALNIAARTCTCGLAFMSHKMLSMAEPIQHLSSANHSNSHSFESVWALFSLTPILSST